MIINSIASRERLAMHSQKMTPQCSVSMKTNDKLGVDDHPNSG